MTRNTLKARVYRHKQAAKGRRLTGVYLADSVHDAIAAAVQRGDYESKQALLEAAVCAFVATEINPAAHDVS